MLLKIRVSISSLKCPILHTLPRTHPVQKQWQSLGAYCAWLSEWSHDLLLCVCVCVRLCNYPWQAGIPTNTMCKVHIILGGTSNYTPYSLLHAPSCMWLQHVSMLIHCAWRILLSIQIRIVYPGANKTIQISGTWRVTTNKTL